MERQGVIECPEKPPRSKKTKKGENVEQTLTARNHERSDWDPAWKIIFPWVERCVIDEKPFMICLWSKKYNPASNNLFVSGCNTFKKYYLNQYFKTNDHVNAM
ncbi:20716_t:CDS:1, partial [Cetraspora pellucida]